MTPAVPPAAPAAMTREEVYARIRDLLAKKFELDPARITPTATLFADLELDSIDAIDMVVELEEWAGKRVPEEELRAMKTVDDVVTLVEKHLADGAAAPPAAGSGQVTGT